MRWLVDGMNVIGSRPDGWWKDRHAAMAGLVQSLERWAADGEDEVIVVFEHPPKPPIDSKRIGVASAPESKPDAADDEIVRLLGESADPAEWTVVTSDRRLAGRVRATGAAVESAGPFRRRLAERPDQDSNLGPTP
jgi:predicted RNA-binding protein with PIN domain